MAQYQGWGGPSSGQAWQQPNYDAQASYGGGVNNRGGMFQPMNWGGARPSWSGVVPGGQTATSANTSATPSWGGYVGGQYRGLDAPAATGAPPAAAPAIENAAPQSAVQSGIPYQALATALANPATGAGEGPYAPSVRNTPAGGGNHLGPQPRVSPNTGPGSYYAQQYNITPEQFNAIAPDQRAAVFGNGATLGSMTPDAITSSVLGLPATTYNPTGLADAQQYWAAQLANAPASYWGNPSYPGGQTAV